MIYRFASCALSLIVFCWISAMAGEKPKTRKLEDLLEAKVFQGKNGKTLPYRLLAPEKIEEGKQYPLIIFLHGAGERGTDNLAQLVHCVKDFTPAKVRSQYPCYLVVPQCPPNDGWIKQSLWGLAKHTMEEKPGPSLGLVLEMIPKLVKELPGVDAQRVYVAGLSMGGYGTWELLQRAPELFAAGIPICGGGGRGPGGPGRQGSPLGLPRRQGRRRQTGPHDRHGGRRKESRRHRQVDHVQGRRPR